MIDRLDAMTPRWDDIVDRARRSRSVREVHDVEELAQHFADDVVTAVRGRDARRPSTGSVIGGDRKGVYG